MKTIIILAHPDITHSNISKTWITSLNEKNPEIKVHNIYELYPDWQIDTVAEQALLEEYDRVIFQYPLFWYNMPPLLKKWLDEVFAYGWAYGSTGDKLAGKEFGLAVTTGGIEDVYQESVYGTISQLLQPMISTAKFVNAKYIGQHIFYGALAPDVDSRLAINTAQYIDFVTK